jgi:hypothetical protein
LKYDDLNRKALDWERRYGILEAQMRSMQDEHELELRSSGDSSKQFED